GAGEAVVVMGGSAGMGLEPARLARAEGAEVILAARDPDRLERAAAEVGAVSIAAFDATDPAALDRFFAGLPEQIDHIMVTGPGPYYAPLAELDRDLAHREFDVHLWLPIAVTQHAVGRVRPGGTLLFIGGTRRRAGGPAPFPRGPGRPRPRAGPVADRGRHRRGARPDRQPRAGGCPGPGQPHRGRVRRHPAVRRAARRRPGRAARPAPRHPADQARG